jgi:hypothetical protein
MYIWNWETNKLMNKHIVSNENIFCNSVDWNPQTPDIIATACDDGIVTMYVLYSTISTLLKYKK